MDFNELPNYMDPFGVDHNPLNTPSMTEFYLYLFAALVGLCLLFWAGYLQFRERNNDVVAFIGGMITIGVSFVNISPVKLSETNLFVVVVLIFVHGIACGLIVEGSTRYFILRDEKRIKRQNDLAETKRINEIYENLL